MKKSIVFLLIILFFTCLCNFSYANTETNNNNLFLPNISKRTTPNDLLVMVFLYDDYSNHNEKIDYIFNMTDQEIETKYHNEIFGSGNIEEQTWSINDFFKENSNGKFYFSPILIGENTTGIYPIRLNKTYDESNFSSDMKEGFKTLTDKGFVPNGFNAKVITGKAQEKQVLCIFPRVKIPHVATYYLNEDTFSKLAVTDFCTVLSGTTHELGHTLEMPDLYGQGGQASLMSETTLSSTITDLRYPGASNNYTLPAHIDPLHKIALGWSDYEIIDENTTIKLYPTTSPLYNIVIVPTDDNNQYYIIENRKAVSFESQINLYASRGDIDDPEDAGYSNYEGINVWRIDKLGYENLSSAYNTPNRKGDFIISTLKYPMEYFFPKKYSSIDDVSNILKENTNIKITYVKSNDDNSIDVDITFDDKYTNSYVVRYNANDGTSNYVDKTYTYTQNIDFSTNLFSRDGYKLMGWNTKQDGSGTNYIFYDTTYGLSDDDGAVVNLYAQWEKNAISIQFDANGGSGIMEEQTVTKGKYILPECEFTKYDSNHVFDGWFVESEHAVLKPGDIIYVYNDIKLIAQWRQKICTVSFNTDGCGDIANQTIEYGENAIEPDSLFKEGYTFGGWYEDNIYQSEFYFENPITADKTLYAKWIPNEHIIKEMNIEISLPTVGDDITIEKEEEYWDWNTQKPQLDIKIEKEANYNLASNSGAYMFWITDFDFDYEINPFIGTFEYDKDYYIRTSLMPKDEYYFDENIKIIVNGKPVNKIFHLDSNYVSIGVILNATKESELVTYKILEGENQTYNISEGNNLTIKANGELSKFLELKVDNTTLDSSNYSLISGSTIVTLKNDYLNTLNDGEHSVTFVYIDGEITTSFKVKKNKVDNNPEESIDVNEKEENNIFDNEKKEDTTTITNPLPKTGDDENTWICLFILSCLSVIVTGILLKKIK